MSLVFGGLLVVLGVVGAFVAGLLGVGGAIVMIPFLLYVPPLLGVGRFDVKTVAAITMVQVLVAAVSGVVAHGRHRAVNPRLAWIGGLTMAVGSLAGAVASKHVPHRVLLIVFALMVTAAFALMFLPDPPADITTPAEAKPYRRRLIMAVTGGVGLAAGLVGAGGAFLLVPLLLVVVGVPIRVTIGSSLAITAFAATAGVAGKLATHQVPLVPALLVALGALPGAQLGVLASQRLSGVALKRILFLVIVLTGVRVWWDVLVD
ncbi:MAG: sulfite exporter TauE/SafE family protein [Candidatus Rokuibacteriota bacterium]|nr:MAG: sulfite exporter TauE/SafE family protein [Candidatus Rokubacteria bacterium]